MGEDREGIMCRDRGLSVEEYLGLWICVCAYRSMLSCMCVSRQVGMYVGWGT